MNKCFYVSVYFDDGRSLCETFFDVGQAVCSFNEWQCCSSVLEVTLEFKDMLNSYSREFDDDED